MTPDVEGNDTEDTGSIRAAKQKSDQLGVSQLADMLAIPAWGDACSVRVPSGWLRFRDWLREHKSRDGRLPGNSVVQRGNADSNARLVRSSDSHWRPRVFPQR